MCFRRLRFHRDPSIAIPIAAAMACRLAIHGPSRQSRDGIATFDLLTRSVSEGGYLNGSSFKKRVRDRCRSDARPRSHVGLVQLSANLKIKNPSSMSIGPADRISQTELLLNSYRHWLGHELLDRSGTLAEQAERLWKAPFVVVSHATQSDPVLNYGNQTALDLWELDLDRFCQTPSRLTAEPMHRDERARLLDRTTRNGFVDDYSGIRISSTGRRFFIPRAIVWNLIDADGRYAGQAATFSEWRFLEA